MLNKMEEPYFQEKKEFACAALAHAIREAQASLELIQTARYTMPDLVNAENIHDMLRQAEVEIRSARRDFEKARWAAARTELEFKEWLELGPARELS